MRDTGFKNTHNIIVRLIRMSIETGCVTGKRVHSAISIFIVLIEVILALINSVVLVLLCLPSHLPYYSAAVSIVTKAYSNSMMAVLNSRIKPISNAPSLEAPLWNELERLTGSIQSGQRTRREVFFEDAGACSILHCGPENALA